MFLKQYSQIIKELSPDKFLELTTDNMLAEFDKYSRYNKNSTDAKLTAKTTLPQVIVTSGSYMNTKKQNKPGNGYLTLIVSSFEEETSYQIEQAIYSYQKNARNKFKGIVIDLRNNKGGSLIQSVASADLFLNKGKIASITGRNKAAKQSYFADEKEIAKDIPIIILINSSTASSAELFTAALQENKRAKVVGENSYGKSSVQTSIPLPNKGEIVLSWGHFLTPKGENIHNKGIIPDAKISLKQYDKDSSVFVD